MEQAGYNLMNPSNTREVVGGLAQAIVDGELAPGYRTVSILRADATPGRSTPLTAGEIAQSTGGSPVAGFHTHQLAERNHKPEKRHRSGPAPEDLRTVRKLLRPELVITRTKVSLAWVDDSGDVRTATVMEYRDVNSLKSGDVTIRVPAAIF